MIVKINEGTANERVIGELDLDRKIFFKTVRFSKHLYKKLDAWGIDAQYFKDVLLPNNIWVSIYDEEIGMWYGAWSQEIEKHGTHLHFKDKGEDHRAQIFLPRSYWRKLKET